MILKELVNCYGLMCDSLKHDPDKFKIASFDRSIESISFRFIIGEDGLIKQIIDLRDGKLAIRMEVPIQFGRSSGISPYFLCDTSKYFLGCQIDSKSEKLTNFEKNFISSKQLHEKVLGETNNKGFKAVLQFFVRKEENVKIALEMDPESLKGGRIVFSLENERGYIHNYEDVKDKIKIYKDLLDPNINVFNGMCLVSGEKGVPISRTHLKIGGIARANASGASIVSFNGKAFESYGKEQSYNASVSEISMFKYTTALNALLRSKNNSMYLSGNTVVFWSDKVGGVEDFIIGDFIRGDEFEKDDEDKSSTDENVGYNQKGTNEIESILSLIRRGMTVDVNEVKDDSTNIYILGLAPSNARIFIRFWFKNSLKEFIKLSNKHFEDTKLIRKSKDDNSRIEEVGVKVSDILKTITLNGKVENVPNTVINSLFKSILTGNIYPMSVYNRVLLRVRHDYGLNHTRISFIKGYLKRYYRLMGLKNKEEEVTVSINVNSNSTGYNLGRVFAILEKIQGDANEGKSNIREKYLSVASSTPRNIFPILLNLSQHHISKINKSNNRNFNYYDKLVGDVLSGISEFPSILSSDEQGMFMLGYYHQRQDIFTKKEDKESN